MGLASSALSSWLYYTLSARYIYNTIPPPTSMPAYAYSIQLSSSKNLHPVHVTCEFENEKLEEEKTSRKSLGNWNESERSDFEIFSVKKCQSSICGTTER